MRTRKTYRPVRIDFTPFTAVALLLICFFVFLEVGKRDSDMPVELFNKGKREYHTEGPSRGAICLLLLANNRIDFLRYRPNAHHAEFLEIDYSPKQLRRRLMDIAHHIDNRPIVYVTPTNQSTFKNLVDVFDELNTIGRIGFLLTDLTDVQSDILFQYETYKSKAPTQPVTIRVKL